MNLSLVVLENLQMQPSRSKRATTRGEWTIVVRVSYGVCARIGRDRLKRQIVLHDQ